MVVTSAPVPGWRAVSLNYQQKNYPVPLNGSLPRMYFVGLFVGSRGSGKTYSICTLLKAYQDCGIVDPETREKLAQRIILFSPTSASNPVFTALRHLHEDDIHGEYSDQLLDEVVADIKAERQETIEYQRRLKLYKKFRKARDLKGLNRLTPEELFELERSDFEPPEPPKYPQGCVTFMVLDDLVGSSAFKATGRSSLTNLVLRNRHCGINLLFASQTVRNVPKPIRVNASLLVIFRFANKRVILEDFYEEVSNIVSEAQFIELFEYATPNQHDSLTIDFSQPKNMRFKQNWKSVLTLA